MSTTSKFSLQHCTFAFCSRTEHLRSARSTRIVELQKIENENERLYVFSSYPVDHQIDIYLFSQMPKSRAVDTYFRFMAHQGDQKVLAIAKRIDIEEKASFKTDLIRALDLIDENCECVRNNSDVMELLARNDLAVTDGDPPHIRGFKDLYTSTLERIESRRTSSKELKQ